MQQQRNGTAANEPRKAMSFVSLDIWILRVEYFTYSSPRWVTWIGCLKSNDINVGIHDDLYILFVDNITIWSNNLSHISDQVENLAN